MFPIYYLDNRLIITENPKNYPDIPSVFTKDKKTFCDYVNRWIDDGNRSDSVVYGYPAVKMFHHLEKCFRYVEAAGGVVQNKENRLLFIRRWNIWDLPKGKVDTGEEIQECALREVSEETGVTGLQITKELPVSFHFYFYKEKLHLKKTHWFLMKTDYDGPLKPQREEDISQVSWLDAAGCRKAFRETYRSLRDNLEQVVCTMITTAAV